MAITFSQPRKRQKYLILVLILLIFLFLFLKFFMLKPKIERPEEVITKKPPLIEIDFSVLENPILKKLEIFEEIPPLEKEFGRENPFTPY